MHQFIRRATFSGTLLSTMIMTVSPANAGPLMDWLFGRRYAQPVACANCGPAQAQAGRPVVNYSVPTDRYAATQYAQNPYVTNQSANQYAPAYRSAWQRVPVTNYRPTVGYDPTTGRKVTSLQPCAGYEWQTRRVPVQTYRPVLGWLFGPNRTYAARPTYRVPVSNYAYSAPAYADNSRAYVNSSPADCSGGTRVLTQQNDYYTPRSQPRSNVGVEEGWQDVVGNGDRPPAPALAPGQNVPLPDYGDGSRTRVEQQSLRRETAPQTNAPQTNAPRAALNQPLGNRRPQPIPDPDAKFQTDRPAEAPQLIRPRVKTAVAQPRAGSFVLISWPEDGSGRVRQADLREPVREQLENNDDRDDGWRAVD